MLFAKNKQTRINLKQITKYKIIKITNSKDRINKDNNNNNKYSHNNSMHKIKLLINKICRIINNSNNKLIVFFF